MKPVHMNPEEAVLAHLDLRSKFSIASHFDVFQLADEPFAAPLELQQAISKYNIPDNKFIIPKVVIFSYLIRIKLLLLKLRHCKEMRSS